MRWVAFGLASFWWAVHSFPELGPSHQNIWLPKSPPFPSIVQLLSFIIVCCIYPFIAGSLLDSLVFLYPWGVYIRGYVIWMGLLIIEFMYVNRVVTNRHSFFAGRHGGYRDITAVIVLASMAYLGGPFLHALPPVLFSGAESYKQDFCFIIPFLLMTHCSYLHRLPHEFYASMKYSDIKKSSKTMRSTVVLLLRILPISVLALLRFSHMLQNEPIYFMVHSGVIGILIWISISLSEHYYVHIHHYFIAIFFLFASGYYSNEYYPSIIGYAFCSAAFVEGAARWSCAPLWHKRENNAQNRKKITTTKKSKKK